MLTPQGYTHVLLVTDYLEAPAETAQELAPGTDEEEGRRAGAEYDE